MISFKGKQRISGIFIWFVVFSGLLLSFLMADRVRDWEQQRLEADFAGAAGNRYAALKREIESDIDVLSSVRAFFLHAEVITRAEFRNFVKPLLAKHPGIQALEWIPRVPHSRRSEYETAAIRDGFVNFEITEQVSQGKMARARGRDEYFPVFYVEPYAGNEIALGFDLSSNSRRKETLDRSCSTGEITATAGITLVQEKAGQYGILVFSPVYKRDALARSVQARHVNLKGFAVGVLRIGDIVEKSLTYLKPEAIDVYLYDDSVRGEPSLLYFHPSRRPQEGGLSTPGSRPPAGGLTTAKTLDVAGRTWRMLFVATPDYMAQRKTGHAWIVLAAGLLLTGLISGFLITERRRMAQMAKNNERLVEEIAAHRKTEEERRLNEELFRRIFDEGPVGMVLASPDHRIVTVNQVFCRLLGYEEKELIGRHIDDITYEEDRDVSNKYSGQVLQGSLARFRLEKRYITKDGKYLWANLTAANIHDNEGQVLYGLGIVEDLTDIKKATDKIYRLSYFDGLTGLPNRTFFKELLERTVEHARRYKEKFAVIYIELDNFKRINDSLGHQVGDLLLKAVAERICGSLRNSDYIGRLCEEDPKDIIYRVGGDEFVVLAQNLRQAEDVARITGRLLADIAAPYRLAEHEVFITASIGIALYPEDGADVDNLMQNADAAMGYAKNQGKNNFQFYSRSINSAILEHLKLENDLRKALERDQFLLYYQPRVEAGTGVITGIEALIRWQHPNNGLIMPGAFIPQAEASGLIIPIGEQVFRIMAAHIKEWPAASSRRVNIAVNVSSRQFDQKNLGEIMRGLLHDTVPPPHLELEITESTIMRNPEEAIRTLREIKAMGVQIAIDDFGIGYSSLSYLQRLPLDYLKIDQSFVANLASDPGDQAIVRATIAMAHSLNLKVIAEGVEKEDQLSFLREHGCDEIQGFLFSRPVPAEQIPEILAKGRL